MRELHKVISVFPSDSRGRQTRYQRNECLGWSTSKGFVFRGGGIMGGELFIARLVPVPLPDGCCICHCGAVLTSEAISESVGQ